MYPAGRSYRRCSQSSIGISHYVRGGEIERKVHNMCEIIELSNCLVDNSDVFPLTLVLITCNNCALSNDVSGRMQVEANAIFPLPVLNFFCKTTLSEG